MPDQPPPSRSASGPRWPAEALVVLLLLAAAAGLLRHHLSGHSLFLGNYDRLGYFLSNRLSELDAIRSRGSPADWDERMFMGFDAADLPGASTPFSPLRIVTTFAPRPEFYFWAGVCVVGLMGLAGAAAYVCLRQLGLGRIASFGGAVIYMGSTHTMIRLAQSDSAGLLLAMLPTGAWLVFGATTDQIRRRLVGLGLISALILLSVTGPLTIYTMGLWVCLALFQAWRTRRIAPLSVCAGGILCGLLIAAPHLRGVAADLGGYVRDGGVGRSFDEIYEFFNVRPYEILRAFDDGLFGGFPAEVAAIGNNLNLNEGFQVYSGTFATLCVLGVMLRYRGEWFRLFRGRDGLLSFFAWVLVAVAAVILIKPAGEVFFHLFLNANLIHARLSLIGTLAATVLAALGLQQCVETVARHRAPLWSWLIAAVAASLLWLGVAAIRDCSPQPGKIDLRRPPAETARTLLSLLQPGGSPLDAPTAVMAVRIAPRTIRLSWQHAGPTADFFEVTMGRDEGPRSVIGRTSARNYDIGDIDPVAAYWFTLRAHNPAGFSPASKPVKATLYVAPAANSAMPHYNPAPVWLLTGRLLALLASLGIFVLLAGFRQRPNAGSAFAAQIMVAIVLIQVVKEADERWNGAQTQTFPRPFASDNFFNAPPHSLHSGHPDLAAELSLRLDPSRYRTVFIAAPEQFMHFVSPHLTSYWNLRSVEGYLSGVPSRLAALPWTEDNIGFRHIAFTSPERLPWELLGKLNVRQAVVVNPTLYFDAGSGAEMASPSPLQVIPNPSRVLPREFFAARGRPVPPFSLGTKVSLEELAGAPDTITVEGLDKERHWPTGGTIEANYRGGRISLRLDRSPQARFLVLNELYHPGWLAHAGQSELKVYAVNTVMRGVEIPAGVTTVELEFRPYSRFPGWWLFPMTGLLLLGACALPFPGASDATRDGASERIPSPTLRLFAKPAEWLRDPKILRWLAVGVASTGLNLSLLYALVSGFGVPFLLAPVFSAEIGIVLRFLANDRWVFGHARPTWQRLWQYHVAVTGGFVAWWATSNLLVYLGVHYLLAALLAIGASLGLNLSTNFLWIWRDRHLGTTHAPAPDPTLIPRR